MLGCTAKHCSMETWKFLKASIGWLDHLEEKKRRDEGLVEKRKQSGRADVPFGHATIASAFSVADNGTRMGNGSKWMVASRARRDTSAVDTESGPKAQPLASHPLLPLPAPSRPRNLRRTNFCSAHPFSQHTPKNHFHKSTRFHFPALVLLVDLILRSISHSTTTKHLKVARPASSISARG